MKFESLLRRVLVAFGLIALAAGLLVMFEPDLAAGAPMAGGTVTAIGVVAVLMGLWQFRSRYRSRLDVTQMPVPELPPNYQIPGNDIDDIIADVIERGHGAIEYRQRIEQRLRETAIGAIQQRDDCLEPEAVEKLESGEWTDNPTAARFFGAETAQASDDGSLLDTLGNSRSANFVDIVETTVDEIVALAALEDREAIDLDEQADEEAGGLIDRLRNRFDGDANDGDVRKAAWNVDASSYDTFDVDPGIHLLETKNTGHWYGISGFGLISIGVGSALPHAGLLVAGAVAIGYAAYARAMSAPSLTNLEIERKFSDSNPNPDETVSVSVTVENTGDQIVPDLRLVDVVPDPVEVLQGSPRIGTALRPGSSATFTYQIEAHRGEFSWPAAVAAADSSGQYEEVGLLGTESELFCAPDLRTITETPVRSQTSQLAGDVNTTVGGVGLEFFAQREYQMGDAMKRVNWKHLAKTGELATIEFREERSAKITLLFDARDSAYQSQQLGAPHALDRSIGAASEIFPSLYDDGNLIGIAAFDTVPCWLAPSSGTQHVERARMLFATHPAVSPIPPDRLGLSKTYIDPLNHVRRQLPINSQIFMFSPLNDDYVEEVARRLDSAGHLVTIISPDNTATRTVGQQIAWVERSLRIRELRERGIRVVDWEADDSIMLALTKSSQRWSA